MPQAEAKAREAGLGKIGKRPEGKALTKAKNKNQNHYLLYANPSAWLLALSKAEAMAKAKEALGE